MRCTLGAMTTTAASAPPADDTGIPSEVKLALPVVAGGLAIFVILLVLKRCGYCDRMCKRKKTRKMEKEDIEMRTMLPPPMPVSSQTRTNGGLLLQPLHVDSRDGSQNRGHYSSHINRALPSTPTPLPCPPRHRNSHTLPRDGTDVVSAGYNAVYDRQLIHQSQRRSRLGNHGYVTMSSGKAASCCKKIPKATYITARHDSSVPVNVCAPILRTHTESECREQYRHRFSQLSLNHQWKPDVRDHRAETVPSCAPLTNIYSNSTHSLPDRLRCTEIPIGPFVSRDTQKEPDMEEAIAQTIASESFENMASFEGAWWHAQPEDTEDEKDAPHLPKKRCQSLPRHMHATGATYVSMTTRKLPRSHTMEGEYVTLPPLHCRRPFDSYITSGQRMRGQSLRLSGQHDKEFAALGRPCPIRKDPHMSLPPPAPCVMSHDYINAKTASHF
ncbi:uncharacterized protein [Haliotis cracherodii]|uniref:uncharacterized protein n=1 Tax=Haliotis cracherodii TaxID=6455 RepID=UPI0039E9629B